MQVEIGSIVDGTVTGIKNFGAFVKLPTGETGMVHISEVAASYVNDINEHLSLGQEVKVKVLGENKGKISLSIKQALPKEENHSRPQKRQQSQRNSRGSVWQGVKQTDNSNMSFEDMMAAFKKTSDEKMSDLRRGSEVRSSRRGNGNRG